MTGHRGPLAAVAAVASAAAAAQVGPAAAGVLPWRQRIWPALHGVGSADSAALTFDDGPDPGSTPRFLQELDRLGVRATFFVLGSRLAAAPGLVREMVAAGHELAVHGWTHRSHLARSPWAVHRDLARAAATTAAAAGRPPQYLRPPYGLLSGGTLLATRHLGLRPVLWTAWGRDWTSTATADTVLAEIADGVRGGGTLLLHDSDCTSAPGSWRAALGALPRIVALARQRGIALVPLGEHLRASAPLPC